jgi:hypothetical protein
MARLPRQIGWSRAPLEVLLGSDDLLGDLAEAYGYVNRSLPDAELDAFVEALATCIASFEKWSIANTRRSRPASLRWRSGRSPTPSAWSRQQLASDVEMAAGWDACIASLARPATQARMKALFAQGFHKPGFINSVISCTPIKSMAY